MSDEKCGNCKFARTEWGEIKQSRAELECHRYPPIKPVRFSDTWKIGRIDSLPRHEDGFGEDGEPDMTLVGEPTYATWYAEPDGGDIHRLGEWPIVFDDHWCGEWKWKPE